LIIDYIYKMKEELFNYDSNEYVIIIGQNKVDNFKIIDDAVNTDIWFHVSELSSCHIILKNNKKMSEIPRQVIKHCAYLCKINSKAKTLPTCDIVYTPISEVIKTDIIGQVLLKKSKSIIV
jgi:predicted ribosome quality control (RQC) complex YloA/Tae2 family protein